MSGAPAVRVPYSWCRDSCNGWLATVSPRQSHPVDRAAGRFHLAMPSLLFEHPTETEAFDPTVGLQPVARPVARLFAGALLFGHSLFGYWGTHTSEGLGLCMAPHKIFFHATHPQSPTLPLSAIGRHHTTTLPINNALPHQSSTFCIGKLAIFDCF